MPLPIALPASLCGRSRRAGARPARVDSDLFKCGCDGVCQPQSVVGAQVDVGLVLEGMLFQIEPHGRRAVAVTNR